VLNKVECMLVFYLLCVVHGDSNFWHIVLLIFRRIFYSLDCFIYFASNY